MIRSLKRVGLAVLLLAVAYGGFRWGATVFPPLERALGWAGGTDPSNSAPPLPSAELADSTLDRFERFRNGEGPDRLVLTGRELTSVVRFALPGLVPPGVEEPFVELSEGRVRLGARVALDAFPRLPRLEGIVGVLPDTVGIRLGGSLVPYDQIHLALMVDKVEASRIPLPRRMVSEVLAGFGRARPRGLPEDALAVPLPDGIQAVYVKQDSLILVAER